MNQCYTFVPHENIRKSSIKLYDILRGFEKETQYRLIAYLKKIIWIIKKLNFEIIYLKLKHRFCDGFYKHSNPSSGKSKLFFDQKSNSSCIFLKCMVNHPKLRMKELTFALLFNGSHSFLHYIDDRIIVTLYKYFRCRRFTTRKLFSARPLLGKGSVTYRFSYAMRHNITNKITPLTPCHIRHFQNFDKIDSFLKLVLNICIIGNLVVGWGEWVIKGGAGIPHQIDRFSRGVNLWGSRAHQGKSWYYLGPSQTSKVESLAEIVFGYKPLTFFVKSSNLDVWLVP